MCFVSDAAASFPTGWLAQTLSDVLNRIHYTIQGLSLSGCAAGIQHSHRVCQDALSGRS